MCGLVANGCGTADGFGGLVIGVIRPIHMPFGWAVIGDEASTVGTGGRVIGDSSVTGLIGNFPGGRILDY